MGLKIKFGALSAVTFIVLSFCYSLFIISFVFNKNLTQTVDKFSDNLKMSVYLKPKATTEQKKLIQKSLSKVRLISDVRFISSKEAHKEFSPKIKTSLKKINLGKSLYLPASFDLKFLPGLHDSEKIFEQISAQVKNLSGVDEVVYAEDVFSNYASFRKTYFSVSSVMWLLIIFTCILVIGNMVRASVVQRSREIEILEFIGATRSYIMKPYLVSGAVIGIIASLLALLVCYFLCYYISQQFSDKGFAMIYLSYLEMFLFVGVGAGLSLIASGVSFLSLKGFARL